MTSQFKTQRTIIIDSREQPYSAEYQRALRTLGVMHRVAKLDPGDIYVHPLLTERKTIHDFLSSYVKGRMQDQASRLVEYCAANDLMPGIIIHGDIKAAVEYRQKNTRNKSITQQFFWDAVTALRAQYPEISIFVLSQYTNPEIAHTHNKKHKTALISEDVTRKLKECIDVLVAMARSVSALDWSYKVPPAVTKLRNPTLKMLAYLGIDQHKAELLQERFGPFHKIVQASRAELVAIDGIADKTADIILEIGGNYDRNPY